MASYCLYLPSYDSIVKRLRIAIWGFQSNLPPKEIILISGTRLPIIHHNPIHYMILTQRHDASLMKACGDYGVGIFGGIVDQKRQCGRVKFSENFKISDCGSPYIYISSSLTEGVSRMWEGFVVCLPILNTVTGFFSAKVSPEKEKVIQDSVKQLQKNILRKTQRCRICPLTIDRKHDIVMIGGSKERVFLRRF